MISLHYFLALFILGVAIVLSFYTIREVPPRYVWLSVICAFLYCTAIFLMHS